MRGKRPKKDEWENLSASKLTQLMAHRIARIEVLKMEIKELQKHIEKKTKLD